MGYANMTNDQAQAELSAMNEFLEQENKPNRSTRPGEHVIPLFPINLNKLSPHQKSSVLNKALAVFTYKEGDED
jgi:hypothetical protein